MGRTADRHGAALRDDGPRAGWAASMTTSAPTPPSIEPSAAVPAATAPPLGRATVRGSFWMMVASVATKAGSVGAQIVLGWLLLPGDFGVYFIALSISLFAQALREGGVRHVLVQSQSEYERLLGPVFWLALALNTLAAVLLAAVAPVAAWVYGDARIAHLLLIIAASVPLSMPSATLQVRLSIDMRFGGLAAVHTLSAALRFIGSILLAWAGFGAYSLVLPLPVMALAEWAVLTRMNRERLWSRPPDVRAWPAIFRRGKWAMLGTFGVAMWNLGNYFIVGLLVPTAVVGLYAWANQVVQQIGSMIGGNVNIVLFPAFSRLSQEPERKRQAVVRVLRQVLFLSAPASVGMAPVFPPLELLIFDGKWAAAAVPIAIIAALYPPTCAMAVPLSVQQARAEFRGSALALLGMTAAAMIAGAIGAALHGSATGIAAWSVAAMAVACVAYSVVVFRPLGIGLARVLAAMVPPWGLAVVCGAISAALEHSLRSSAPPIIRLVLTGACFFGCFALAARGLLPESLRETINMLPHRLRSPLRSAALFPEASDA